MYPSGDSRLYILLCGVQVLISSHTIIPCYFVLLCNQVEAMLTLRREQVEKKMLRSRQRANFELLQERCGGYISCTSSYHGNTVV